MEVAAMGCPMIGKEIHNKTGYIPLGSIPRMHRNSLESYHNHKYLFKIVKVVPSIDQPCRRKQEVDRL